VVILLGRFRKRDGWFDESARKNNIENNQYFKRLAELSMTMFDWQNLPDTIDPRFLELTLFFDGQAVFFKDEELGFLCLQCLTSGNFDVYRIPLQRRAIAVNGYNRDLDQYQETWEHNMENNLQYLEDEYGEDYKLKYKVKSKSEVSTAKLKKMAKAMKESYDIKASTVTKGYKLKVDIIISGSEGLEVTYNKSLVREHEELNARLAALEGAAVNQA
jgi:hypothetical protein